MSTDPASGTSVPPLVVLLFGGSSMVGQGVLRAMLEDPRVGEVRAVLRRPLDLCHKKLTQIVSADLSAAGPHWSGVDLSFHAAGPSASGLTETIYRQQTLTLSTAIARTASTSSPGSALAYVSGAGTASDSRMMWARVKAETEDAIGVLVPRSWFLRPAIIRPAPGTRPATRGGRALDLLLRPIYPVLIGRAPGIATSTEAIAAAVLAAASHDVTPGVLTSAAINELSGRSGP